MARQYPRVDLLLGSNKQPTDDNSFSYRYAIAAWILLAANGCISQTELKRQLEEQRTTLESRHETDKSWAVSSAISQTRATLNATHQEEIQRLNAQHSEELASIAVENEAAIASLKKTHETKIAELTQRHEKKLASELEKTRVQAIKDSETKQWLAANVANIGKHQAFTWAVVSLGVAALYLSINRRMGSLITEMKQGQDLGPVSDGGSTEKGGGAS
ncbi:hypothetical protein LOC71_23135 [Rhodopirellula sp. JC740]|uniref:Uncharacterized protein n=1 Tax=Rhodopirellula halodulae TaxID=2894198 RepID=A0ABS8NNL5_9BACT|nr:hypothetical protein [Rhodopirellula sp. JC740]MCC9645184.1 hypothetical protein [Rhodopirellula sp. JC740]